MIFLINKNVILIWEYFLLHRAIKHFSVRHGEAASVRVLFSASM